MKLDNKVLVALIMVVTIGVSEVYAGSNGEQLFPASKGSEQNGTLIVAPFGDVELDIQIALTPDVAELRVSADSGSFFRETTIELDGLLSESTHNIKWRRFPIGEYEVIGTLLNRDGSPAIVVRGMFKVIER